MLQIFGKRVSGRFYVEVPIGGDPLPGLWVSGSGRRRLDAVRVSGERGHGIFRFNRADFEHHLRDAPVDLIEVKRALSEGAIGQVLAARLMFPRCYGVIPVMSSIIVCDDGIDSALRWVCNHQGIRVKTVPYKSKRSPNSIRWKKRTAEDETVLRAYHSAHGGRMLKGFPVGGKCPAWGHAEEVRLDALHLPDVQPAGIEPATSAHDARWLKGRRIEQIEVAPKLNRLAIGRAVAWQAMIETQYGIKLARSVILCRQNDPALEWVCGQLGIEVKPIP